MNDRIAVIGAGQMGNGIAHVCAQAGLSVTMIDVAAEALERGRKTIAGNLDRQIKKGTIDAAAKDATLGRIADSTDLAAATDAAIVIEAATEHAPLKFKIFAELDRLSPPETILASNTSSISITEIAAKTSRADRVIGMRMRFATKPG